MIQLLAAALLAQAALPDGVWKSDDTSITVTPAKISLPARAGSVSLTQTAEASRKGEGVDDVAQYWSPDHAIEATAYVFMPTYADTALASYGTDRAIRQRFGSRVHLTSEIMLPIGGVADAGIRRVYEDGELRAGEPLVTTALFVRAGRWMVVMRVSGAMARKAEVLATLDAFASGMRFTGDDKPILASPIQIAAPCPGDDRPSATQGPSKAAGPNILVSAMAGSTAFVEKDQTSIPTLVANGKTAICARGMAGPFEILRSANPARDGERILISYDDAGGVYTAEPVLIGSGWVVKRYAIAEVDVLGLYASRPSNAQMTAIVNGQEPKNGPAARVIFKASGDTEINIDPSWMK